MEGHNTGRKVGLAIRSDLGTFLFASADQVQLVCVISLSLSVAWPTCLTWANITPGSVDVCTHERLFILLGSYLVIGCSNGETLYAYWREFDDCNLHNYCISRTLSASDGMIVTNVLLQVRYIHGYYT